MIMRRGTIIKPDVKKHIDNPAKPRRILYDHKTGCIKFQGWKRYEEAEEEE